jgi:glycosyltransferase involved in cell wall biosynthesis
MHIAYVINQYPKVSHSFIRREILELCNQGHFVARYALRGWHSDIVDPIDVAEQKLTRYVLGKGVFPLLISTVLMALLHMRKFLATAKLTLAMIPRSERSFAHHIVTLFEACHLARWLGKSPVDQIHAHFGTNSAELAMLASSLSGIPYSFTVHGCGEFDAPVALRLDLKAKHAKFVSVISDFCAAQVWRWIDFQDWPKVSVVACGLDPNYFVKDITPPTHPHRLVCVGRLCGEKGFTILIAALAQVRAAGIAAELVLVGDGELREYIEGLIEQHRLTDAVRITGWATSKQVQEEILAGRAMVLSSFAEGLPVVVMESYALGRPVVSTRIAAIPDLVKDVETGWLFSPGSVSDAVRAITECLKTPEAECEAMAVRGQRLVFQHHNIEVEAAKLASLFRGDTLRNQADHAFIPTQPTSAKRPQTIEP